MMQDPHLFEAYNQMELSRISRVSLFTILFGPDSSEKVDGWVGHLCFTGEEIETKRAPASQWKGLD